MRRRGETGIRCPPAASADHLPLPIRCSLLRRQHTDPRRTFPRVSKLQRPCHVDALVRPSTTHARETNRRDPSRIVPPRMAGSGPGCRARGCRAWHVACETGGRSRAGRAVRPWITRRRRGRRCKGSDPHGRSNPGRFNPRGSRSADGGSARTAAVRHRDGRCRRGHCPDGRDGGMVSGVDEIARAPVRRRRARAPSRQPGGLGAARTLASREGPGDG